MKRIIIFVLTAVILLSMGGCTKKKADNTVEVFCLNMDVTSSVPESYVLRSKNSDVDKQVDELLGRMQDKPEDSRLRKAIPDEVSVRGHEGQCRYPPPCGDRPPADRPSPCIPGQKSRASQSRPAYGQKIRCR